MKKLTTSITFLLLFYTGCVAPPQSASPEVTSTEKSKFTSSKWDYPTTLVTKADHDDRGCKI